jgi:hypothetical protein
MKIYFFLTILLFSLVCQAQNITGSYRLKSGDLSENRTITFSKHSFNEQHIGDLTSKIGVGIYNIRNNLLILKYQEVSNQDTSKYEISTSNKSIHSSIIDLKVFDMDGLPLIGTYGLRDNKNNPLNFIFTNNNGMGNITIYNNNSIGYFTIDCIGYYRISIPIKKIMGKLVNITAYLRPQTKYYIEPHTVGYKILKHTNEKLVLIENKNTLILERIK